MWRLAKRSPIVFAYYTGIQPRIQLCIARRDIAYHGVPIEHPCKVEILLTPNADYTPPIGSAFEGKHFSGQFKYTQEILVAHCSGIGARCSGTSTNDMGAEISTGKHSDA